LRHTQLGSRRRRWYPTRSGRLLYRQDG
jgi:hypothetical protein